MISPRPVAIAGFSCKKNGISEPNEAANSPNFARFERKAKKFVESKECHGCIPASTAEAGRNGNLLLEMNANSVVRPNGLQKKGCGAID